jgi:hypothetical protein
MVNSTFALCCCHHSSQPLHIILVSMKEAILRKGPVVEIVDSPVPEPGPDDVVTKVVVSGLVP